jgi:hypothetical protein
MPRVLTVRTALSLHQNRFRAAQDGVQAPKVIGTMHGLQGQYNPPGIADYGTVTEMTESLHPFLGQLTGQDLGFSTVPHTPAHGGVSSGGAAGGGGSDPPGGGGGGANGGGGGGRLPFTGLAVGVVAAVGSGLAAAGEALRRTVRERRVR